MTPMVEKPSLSTLFSRLTHEAQDLGRAELRLAKAKLQPHVKAARNAAIFFVVALLIVLASLSALALGLVIALLPLVGAVLAGLIVLVAGLAVAGVLGWLGAKQLSPPKPAKKVAP